MAYSNPVSLGSGATGIASINNVSMVTSVASSVGDLLLAFAWLPDDGTAARPVVSSFGDSAGNAWTIVGTHRDSRSGDRYMAIGACLGATVALPSGSTIICNMSAYTGSVKTIRAVKVSGIAKSAIDALGNTAEGTGNAWSGNATGVLTDPNEIIFGFALARGSFSSGPSGGTNTPGNGFTNTSVNTYGSNIEHTVEYKILSGSTASQTPIGSWLPGGDGGDPAYTWYIAMTVSFKFAPATQRTKVKQTGSFVSKTVKIKQSGAMVTKPTKVKIGGTFI